MEIILKKNCEITLQNPDDFKQFHVTVDGSAMEGTEVLGALGPQATAAGNDEFWISADHVRALANRTSDLEWQQNFTKMLETVRPGYACTM